MLLTSKDIVAYEFGLSSAQRILYTVAAYQKKYGQWPTGLSMDANMAAAVKADLLTPLGWKMLHQRLKVDYDAKGTVIASGPKGLFDYEDYDWNCEDALPTVDKWIWGINLHERNG